MKSSGHYSRRGRITCGYWVYNVFIILVNVTWIGMHHWRDCDRKRGKGEKREGNKERYVYLPKIASTSFISNEYPITVDNVQPHSPVDVISVKRHSRCERKGRVREIFNPRVSFPISRSVLFPPVLSISKWEKEIGRKRKRKKGDKILR